MKMKHSENFQKAIADKKNELEKKHLGGAGGLDVCYEWSDFVDNLLVELIGKHPTENAQTDFALIALGGYGRRELNPQSDIDLLFLFEKILPLNNQVEGVKIIPFLWDIGFKVGHATRTINDCIEISQIDPISKTSMIEARYLYGDEELFKKFEYRLKKKVIMRNPMEFIKAKSFETELRHENFHKTLFLTEPNIKESPGGLRDYQTALWVSAARYDVKTICDIEKRGLISLSEKQELNNALNFLLKLRSDLHFLEKSASDVLIYVHQPSVAKRLGYKGDEKESVVALMNDYYRAADIIYRFNKSITDQAKRYRTKTAMMFQKLVTKQLAPNIFAGSDEIFTKGISSKELASQPETVFTILELMAKHGLKTSPALRTKLDKVGILWKENKPEYEKLVAGFRSILILEDPYEQLRLMRDMKILTAVIPEFHAIRYTTPFDLYHKFTIDDHTFFAIMELDNLKRNDSSECDVLRTLYEAEERKDIVRLAILLHDVGKGDGSHGEDEEIDLEMITRLGFTNDEAVLIGNLVRLHLLMNNVAQRRDIHDGTTIEQFCKKVGDSKTLKRLYLLTYADTKAVAPGVWTSWKGSLLKDIFQLAQNYFDNVSVRSDAGIGFSDLARDFLRGMPKGYIKFRKSADIENDTLLFKTFTGNGKVPIASNKNFTDEPGEITVITMNEHGLLAKLVGTLLSANINIYRSIIFTRNDGIVIDFFRITGYDDKPITDVALGKRIEEKIIRVLKKEVTVEELIRSRHKMVVGSDRLLKIETQFKILNDESFDYTIIEISTRDRLGLLYDITVALADQNLQILFANVTTEGQRAFSSFYVSEMHGGKLIGSEWHAEIKSAVLKKLG